VQLFSTKLCQRDSQNGCGSEATLEQFRGEEAERTNFPRFVDRCVCPLPALPPVGPVGERRTSEMAGAVASGCRRRGPGGAGGRRRCGRGELETGGGGWMIWNQWQTSSARATSMAGRRGPPDRIHNTEKTARYFENRSLQTPVFRGFDRSIRP
jgi:hypothetical protein